MMLHKSMTFDVIRQVYWPETGILRKHMFSVAGGLYRFYVNDCEYLHALPAREKDTYKSP